MAFQNSDLDISLYFDLDNTRLRIQDNSDYAGASPAISTADVVGVYKLTDPNSNILHENVNFNSPDVDIDVSLFSPYVTFTVTDGIYTAIYSVYDSDTATTYSKTFTFTYAASNTPTVVLDVESDVGLATISSTDETAYTSEVTLNARTHTLTYPASWGSTVSTSLVVDSISLTELYTGEYVSTISSDITITQTDDLIIDTTITGEEDHSVWDTDGMYTVRAALNTFYARWQDDKINNPDEGRREEYIWTEINANYTLYNTYKQNGDIENAGVYLNNIQVLLAAEDIDTTVDPSTSVPVTQVIPGYASQWLNGTGVPDPSLGRNGDYYYRQDTGHVYTKSIGAWSDIGLIYSNTTVDGVTLEIVDNDIQIKDDGVTGAKLSPAVAGNGLKQDASGNLNIDTTSGSIVGDIEIRVEILEESVDNLEENQVTGVEVYSTLADLPVTGTLLVSYKVSNDSTVSNNGYYHWSGSAYIKDADIVPVVQTMGVSALDVVSQKENTFAIAQNGEFSDTRETIFVESGISASSNGKFINTFLKDDYDYNIHLIATANDAIVNIHFLKDDGTYDIQTAITINTTGITINKIPTTDYLGFYIYYGLGTTLTEVTTTITRLTDYDIIQTNYAPRYPSFNIEGSYETLLKDDNYLELSSPSGQPTSFSGFEFELINSDFSIGDTIGFGAKDLILTSGAGFIHCIYYDSSEVEISRISIAFETISEKQTSGVIPASTTKIEIRYQTTLVSTVIEGGEFYLTKNAIPYNLDNYSWNRLPVIGGLGIEKEIMYVDYTNGDDENTGVNFDYPLKTFTAAINKTGVDTKIIFKGDTSEKINIKTKNIQRSLTVVGVSGELNRMIAGTEINSATLVGVETEVYQYSLTSFPTDTYWQIFQHDINDDDTLISDSERHPLQRGKEYRCNSKVIRRTDSLVNLLASSDLLYYYDDVADLLYFRVVTGSDLSVNPVYIPSTANIYGNDGTVKLELINIESLYGIVDVSNCNGGKIVDCASKYGYGTGGFKYNLSVGITFERCEATRAFSGTTTGDGFNGHSVLTGDGISKHTTATLIDCWAHDNNDDGYSDHERCESTIIGGLYEYNIKGGLTPAFGAHDTIKNVYARKNDNYGIGTVGGTEVTEGGVGTQTIIEDCISEDNLYNYYVSSDPLLEKNISILKNCISINATNTGYLAGTNGEMILINCYDKDSPTVSSGTITIKNGTLIS